jgi:hypothetical protein
MNRIIAQLAVATVFLVGIHSSQGEDAAQRGIRPLVTLTGTDSRVKERSYHLIRSEKEWIKTWQRHKGEKESKDYDHFYNPLGMPEIDFEKCMVIAAFQGSGWNSAGLMTTTLKEEENRIVFRFHSKSYQTLSRSGDSRKKVTVYGFFVLPRSDKMVVVEEEYYSLDLKNYWWKERATFPEARNRDKSSSQPFPPEGP